MVLNKLEPYFLTRTLREKISRLVKTAGLALSVKDVLSKVIVATIAVTGIDIVEITTTLAPLLGTLWFPSNGQPRPTLGTVGRIREILEMAPGASIARTEVRTTLFTEFCILPIGCSTASTFHGEYPIN